MSKKQPERRKPATVARHSEEDWAAIQQRAITEAEAVKCPLEEFLEGLKTMRVELADRISLLESEIEHH